MQTSTRWSRWLAHASFGVWLVLSLTTPSWRYGAFSWWPLLSFEEVAGAPVSFGIMNLLPLAMIFFWAAARLTDRARRPWQWGLLPLTLSLAILTLLSFLTLPLELDRRTFIHGGGLIFTWIVYLFVINERPRLVLPLSLVILVQSGVALGQFLTQRDLGLVFLGELPLHPGWTGISVIAARGQPWLRGYGLTAHPNLLGAMLAALLLLLIPALPERWQQVAGGQIGRPGVLVLVLVIVTGLLGLVVSFSRAGWLGFGAGLLLWLLLQRREYAGGALLAFRKRWLLLLLLPAVLLLFYYRDLVLGRFFALDSPLEAQSIAERLRDMNLAIRVIATEPWTGVGLGNYVYAAQVLDEAAARVHNVPLLVAAELGLPALVAWLVIMVTPYVATARRGMPTAAQLAPWTALVVVNFFDTMLWWSSNWQTAILFGLLAAHLVWNVTADAAEEVTSTSKAATAARSSARDDSGSSGGSPRQVSQERPLR